MKTSQHFLLGLLLIAALATLGYFTFVLSDFTLFGHKQYLTVHFPQGGGLRKGDSVLVAGVRYGKVTDITFEPEVLDPAKRVTVILTLDQSVTLRKGHSIVIKDSTVLGGKNLIIDPGSPGDEAIGAGDALLGTVEPNAIAGLGELLDKNDAAITETIAILHDLVKGVERGEGTLGMLFVDEEFSADLSRAVEGAADSVENIRELSDRLVAGEGTIGKLFTSDEMYAELKDISGSLKALLAEANGVVEDLHGGRGLLGAALTDDALAQDVRDGVRNIKEIVERANRGEGTLGKILVDGAIAENLDTVIRRLVDGEGTLGRLFAEEEVYDDLRAISSDLRDIVATVRDGRGTLGKLVMEEGMYTELVKTVNLLTRSLEEYREAAPISTMTSVIFGAF